MLLMLKREEPQLPCPLLQSVYVRHITYVYCIVIQLNYVRHITFPMYCIVKFNNRNTFKLNSIALLSSTKIRGSCNRHQRQNFLNIHIDHHVFVLNIHEQVILLLGFDRSRSTYCIDTDNHITKFTYFIQIRQHIVALS